MTVSDGLVGGPLEGCRVVDLTRILSGPYATMLLADLGAEVIKVERPGGGDDTRSWGPPFWGELSTYFAAVNRGKRSVVVDLSMEEGRELVRRLAATADVVTENFRPGVTRRLGLDYQTLAADNPRLVYASISGFGSTGPKSQEAGTEVIVEAETGLMAMMGTPDGPPVRFGVAMVDIATGVTMISGVLAALLQRERTGVGRYLEFPLFATAMSAIGTVITSASVDPESQRGRWGSGHPSIVPYSAFRALDGHVVLGAINEDMWERLCLALDLAELLRDERTRGNQARVQHRRLVESGVGRAVSELPVAEVARRLGARGVLVAPVKSADEAIQDPQVRHLGLVDVIDGINFIRSPLAQFNPSSLPPAPNLGQDTAAVLQAHLGLGDDHIIRLRGLGVIHTAPPTEAPSVVTVQVSPAGAGTSTDASPPLERI
ncbi:MAG: CoA transferase [Actinomycetota bacterium]|nr:CoA transferase [Actinomycetota bacterium]